MSTTRRPSSIDGIKRYAKSIVRETGLTHAIALNQAAKLAGFQNFQHARRSLTASHALPETASHDEHSPRAFHQQTRHAWASAVNAINPDSAPSLSWEGISTIRTKLAPFMGPSANHAHLPSGGGRDFLSANASNEERCIDFSVGSHSSYVAKPRRLTLERIALAPAESFLLLELDILHPCGVYEPRDRNDTADSIYDRVSRYEEVLEIAPREYLDRRIWDDGHLGYDENGDEIPLPSDARLVIRCLRGKILFVCKTSMWNGTSSTYDGRHNQMTAADIRQVIERSIKAVG